MFEMMPSLQEPLWKENILLSVWMQPKCVFLHKLCSNSSYAGRSWGPWLVGSRRFSPSRRTPRRQQRRRNLRVQTRRPPLRPLWSTRAPSVGSVWNTASWRLTPKLSESWISSFELFVRFSRYSRQQFKLWLQATCSVCFWRAWLMFPYDKLAVLAPSDTDAWPQNLQAALWEQTPQIPDASWAGGRSGVNYCWLDQNLGRQPLCFNFFLLTSDYYKHETKHGPFLTDTQWPRIWRRIMAPEGHWRWTLGPVSIHGRRAGGCVYVLCT